MAYYVYLLASKKHGTLYLGVTNDLVRRGHEHRTKAIDSFTSRYGVNKLVWFEIYDDAITAIAREKELKKWRRDWKIRLIEEKSGVGGFVSRDYKLTPGLWIPGPRKDACPGMTRGNSRELISDSNFKQPNRHTPAFSRHDASELLRQRPPEKQRAQGMPDARRVRSRVRSGRKHTR